MKIKPYINFNGNCTEAIALYEKAFNAKALVMKMGDAPPEEGYQLPPGTENLVMHASLTFGNDHCILMSDCTPDMQVGFGNAVSVYLEFDDAKGLDFSFNALKEGGEVSMEPMPTFWSNRFGMLTDRFGVNWIFSVA